MKKCIKCVNITHIINKQNLNLMGEEIVAAEKKYEAILDYCLSDSNIPKNSNHIFNYEAKKHFSDLGTKENDVK